MRELVRDPFDLARAERRDLLAVPPVLHGQAEARRHRRPRRALPAAAREGRPLGARAAPPSHGTGNRRPGRPRGRHDARPAQLGGRGSQARRRDRAGRAARSTRSMARHWTLRLPIVRGVVALGESLSIGFRALSVSANYARTPTTAEGDAEPVEIGRWTIFFSFAVAIGFALMRLQGRPGAPRRPAADQRTAPGSCSSRALIRVSRLRRLPRAAQPASRRSSASSSTTPPSTRRSTPTRPARSSRPEMAQRYSLIHPRCGTSFLLLGDRDQRLRLRALRPARRYWLIVTPDRVPARDRRASPTS